MGHTSRILNVNIFSTVFSLNGEVQTLSDYKKLGKPFLLLSVDYFNAKLQRWGWKQGLYFFLPNPRLKLHKDKG